MIPNGKRGFLLPRFFGVMPIGICTRDLFDCDMKMCTSRLAFFLTLFYSSLFFIQPSAQINFTSSQLSGFTFDKPSVIQFGPDGRLYVAESMGRIYALDVVRNGPNDYVLVGGEGIDLIKNIPNHDDDGSLNTYYKSRLLTGMIVAGTASNPIIYASSSDERFGGGNFSTGDRDLDTNSGILSKLTWNGTSWEKVDLVRGFPRSEENHATNGLAIKGDTLFMTIGSNTNAGGPAAYFAGLCEFSYSSAMVYMLLSTLDAMPTQIDGMGFDYKYQLPTLDDPTRTNISATAGYTDPNDPWGGNDGLNMAKLEVGGPVQIYASGLRNAYDIVITELGHMFTIDNGANFGYGGFPENEGPPSGGNSAATNNYVSGEPGTVNNKNGLYNITGPGFYAGHPNPTRANPAGAGLYTHDGTTGIWRTSTTGPNPLPADWPPVPVSMKNPVEGDFLLPGPASGALLVYDQSTNGMTEYTATNFGGALKGDLLAVGYHNTGKLYRADLDGTGQALIGGVNLMMDGFANKPLGITSQGDNDDFPGTVWVCAYGDNKVYILEPDDYCQGVTATADFIADPPGSGDIDASTHNPNSFTITNNSPDGHQIEKVTIDLSSAIMMDMVFDPNGTAGDGFAKTFTPNTGAVNTGYGSFAFKGAHDNGYDSLEIVFSDFDQGESFSFSLDIDPTSIQGSTTPGPGNAGYVSGMELTGAGVTITYSGCATYTTELFAITGDVEGAENTIRETLPTTPTLDIVGLSGPDVTVFTASQTARISGPVGKTVRLLVAEAGFFVSGGGFDPDPYEANSFVGVTQHTAVIGGGGSVDIPITLTLSDPDAGYNYIAAVIEESGITSKLSQLWRVKYEPPSTPLNHTVYINGGEFLTPDAQNFPYLAFNDSKTFSVNNSVIKLTPGQILNLKVVNQDTIPHNFQVQGQTLSAAAIPAGDSANYSFSFASEGTYIFYDDLDGQDNSYMGLTGLIDVQIFAGKRFYWNIKEHQSLWNFLLESGGSVNYANFNPDYFSVNGKSYPDLQSDTTAIIQANVGETIRLAISNTGLHKHAIHFHGYHLEVIYSSKYPSHVGRVKDSFPIDPYESIILELTPSKPGTYPVHDHNLVAVTGAGEYPNGMIAFITIL